MGSKTKTKPKRTRDLVEEAALPAMDPGTPEAGPTIQQQNVVSVLDRADELAQHVPAGNKIVRAHIETLERSLATEQRARRQERESMQRTHENILAEAQERFDEDLKEAEEKVVQAEAGKDKAERDMAAWKDRLQRAQREIER